MTPRRKALAVAALLLVALSGWLVVGGQPPTSVEADTGEGPATAGTAARVDRSMLGAEAPSETPANTDRRSMPDVLTVRNPAGEPIDGAEVLFFDEDCDLIRRLVSRTDGTVPRPRDLHYAGWAVRKAGYAFVGVDPQAPECVLLPLREIEVTAVHAADALLADYTLIASIHYGEARFPAEFARVHLQRTKGEHSAAMYPARDRMACVLEHPIENEFVVRLHGLHLMTQQQVLLDAKRLHRDADSVAFDLARNWANNRGFLTVRVHVPEPVRNYYFSLVTRPFRASAIGVSQGEWEQPRRQFEFTVLGIPPGSWIPYLRISGMPGWACAQVHFDRILVPPGGEVIDLRPGTGGGRLHVLLHPKSEGVELSIYVSRAEGGEALDMRKVRTSQGWELAWLRPGRYRVRVTGDGKASFDQEVQVVADQLAAVTCRLVRRTDLKLILPRVEGAFSRGIRPPRADPLTLTWLDPPPDAPEGERVRQVWVHRGPAQMNVPEGCYRLTGRRNDQQLDREFHVQGPRQTVAL